MVNSIAKSKTKKHATAMLGELRVLVGEMGKVETIAETRQKQDQHGKRTILINSSVLKVGGLTVFFFIP